MHRLTIAAGCAGITLLGAACGSSAAGAGASSSQTTASSTDSGAGGRGGGGTRGELVKLDASTLILNTTAGDVTVSFTSSTTVLKTSTAALADIQPGTCITATGTKDATGALTVTGVALTDAVNGSCAGVGGGAFGRGPGTGSASSNSTASATPSPSRSPRPNAGNFAGVRGLVKAVDGTSITVTPIPFTPPGASSSSSTTSVADQTITVPTTVTVSRTAQATTADLAVGDCVAATGQKDATTGVVAARALSIQPAGPTGCFTGARGGGFGGGGFGGGGFGGGGGGGGGAATSVGG